jgi:hypothetical protein
LYVNRFGSKNSLSLSEEGSRCGNKWRKQVVEAITQIEATGRFEGVGLGVDQTIVF